VARGMSLQSHIRHRKWAHDGPCRHGTCGPRCANRYKRPVPQAIDRLARAHRRPRRTQYRARAVGEQHAQVAIAAFGDAAAMAGAAGRMLFWCEAEPGGEVARIVEVADLAGRGRHHRGRGQQADAGDRQQRGAGPVAEPTLELDARKVMGFDHSPGTIGHGELEQGRPQTHRLTFAMYWANSGPKAARSAFSSGMIWKSVRYQQKATTNK